MENQAIQLVLHGAWFMKRFGIVWYLKISLFNLAK